MKMACQFLMFLDHEYSVSQRFEYSVSSPQITQSGKNIEEIIENVPKSFLFEKKTAFSRRFFTVFAKKVGFLPHKRHILWNLCRKSGRHVRPIKVVKTQKKAQKMRRNFFPPKKLLFCVVFSQFSPKKQLFCLENVFFRLILLRNLFRNSGKHLRSIKVVKILKGNIENAQKVV